ncbi:ACT domain-containing protein [Streptomyces hyaluromycini]|uniref:ACT domain-containing protein n=1 Tax=Streptomyces hyaluromycini TaxID=1377993 RepID=UPI000B5C92B1|nr:ACT domain-containing protein [Streptomyces hyaluromycini]
MQTVRQSAGLRAVLDIDVTARPQAVARVASIVAFRQFELTTLQVDELIDDRRRITIHVRVSDETRLEQLKKFLYRTPDVIKIITRLED